MYISGPYLRPTWREFQEILPRIWIFNKGLQSATQDDSGLLDEMEQVNK